MEGAGVWADWRAAMVEKLVRVLCRAAAEKGMAGFLREFDARRAEGGHERWRRNDRVAWRNPRLTADMMLREGGLRLLCTVRWVSIETAEARVRGIQRKKGPSPEQLVSLLQCKA